MQNELDAPVPRAAVVAGVRGDRGERAVAERPQSRCRNAVRRDQSLDDGFRAVARSPQIRVDVTDRIGVADDVNLQRGIGLEPEVLMFALLQEVAWQAIREQRWIFAPGVIFLLRGGGKCRKDGERQEEKNLSCHRSRSFSSGIAGGRDGCSNGRHRRA
ncbi:MAG TPA: hypothetical protein VI391_06055 [Thermoanaerobaculia bacterium]